MTQMSADKIQKAIAPAFKLLIVLISPVPGSIEREANQPKYQRM
jgi:hypothetical protein